MVEMNLQTTKWEEDEKAPSPNPFKPVFDKIIKKFIQCYRIFILAAMT